MCPATRMASAAAAALSGRDGRHDDAFRLYDAAMVERVQEAAEPVWGRRLLVLVAVLNGVLATIWVCAFDNLRYLALVYGPVVGLVALPLMMRSWRVFRATCVVVTAVLLVSGVLLYFFSLAFFWPSAAILLLALTPLARWRPKRAALLLAALVAVPWGVAIARL